MPKRLPELPDAPEGLDQDDPETVAGEPSVATIIKRIRERSEGSSTDAREGHCSPPFARSRLYHAINCP